MTVPTQWKTSLIIPIPKVSQPTSPSDFRPISLTPILSRLLEKMVVQFCFYPILVQPSIAPSFMDQFAFRPSGSTTSALIYLFHHVSNLLVNNPYVHIVALDFSKAFDTVKHDVLISKLGKNQLSEPIVNWVESYLSGRSHITKYESTYSSKASISASVVQGSALGPVSFLLYISDLHASISGNLMAKYADDYYLPVILLACLKKWRISQIWRRETV